MCISHPAAVPEILCFGVNHQTSPVEMRERLSTCFDNLILTDGKLSDFLDEWTLLSTCNRLELYAAVPGDVDAVLIRLQNLFAEIASVNQEQIVRHQYYERGLAAADHLCRVAAGLESLVLGESQIQGQVTAAYMHAVKQGTVGPVLTAMFRSAIHVGKRARSVTSIGVNPTSVSSIAFELAESLVPELPRRNILVVGLGEMGQLTLKTLNAHRLSRVAIANRTFMRAEGARLRPEWRAYSLDQLPDALTWADVVFSATGSSLPIITREVVRDVQSRANGSGKELVLIDMAVPRDIDPAIQDLPNIHLRDIDHLNSTLDASLAVRRRAIPQVEAIIAHELDRLKDELRELAIRPLVVDLRISAERIRQAEVARTLRFLGDVDADTVEHVEHLSRALVNKLLHEPTVRIKEAARNGSSHDLAVAIRDLFDLDSDAVGPIDAALVADAPAVDADESA